MIMRGPVALAARSPGYNPAKVLKGQDLNQVFVRSKGEPLSYYLRLRPDVQVRPYYTVAAGELCFVELDPDQDSHRAARFFGQGWRDTGAFRSNDRPGASASFDFRGTGIRWIGYRFDDAGTAELSIDGLPVGTADQYASVRDEPFEWQKDGLRDGRHRLTITILEQAASASKGRFINVAGFEVLHSERR
jgi:hypothetical protein